MQTLHWLERCDFLCYVSNTVDLYSEGKVNSIISTCSDVAHEGSCWCYAWIVRKNASLHASLPYRFYILSFLIYYSRLFFPASLPLLVSRSLPPYLPLPHSPLSPYPLPLPLRRVLSTCHSLSVPGEYWLLERIPTTRLCWSQLTLPAAVGRTGTYPEVNGRARTCRDVLARRFGGAHCQCWAISDFMACGATGPIWALRDMNGGFTYRGEGGGRAGEGRRWSWGQQIVMSLFIYVYLYIRYSNASIQFGAVFLIL